MINYLFKKKNVHTQTEKRNVKISKHYAIRHQFIIQNRRQFVYNGKKNLRLYIVFVGMSHLEKACRGIFNLK